MVNAITAQNPDFVLFSFDVSQAFAKGLTFEEYARATGLGHHRHASSPRDGWRRLAIVFHRGFEDETIEGGAFFKLPLHALSSTRWR